MIEIQKLVSLPPLNSYAPTWDISIGVATWEEEEKIDKLNQYLLKKEKEILELNPNEPFMHDGGTGLGYGSVTARFGQYNLFDFENEESTLTDLLTWLRKSYIMFVEKDGTPIEDLLIVCWYNIMETGGKINSHYHGASPQTYLSGNIHLDNYNTKTFYQFPFEKEMFHHLQNKKGQVTFFPGYMNHHTDEFEGPDKRLSIAFDLWVKEHGVPSPLKTREFMNKDIANEIRSS